ncbi:ADP-ribosylation factor-binding protein GGA1-like [Limulus polyphemus]|uniref:ADP-ribosylation factor-binding protein GGA1-like n=1 Tax=Limulus polyphemus TaxID=6850 RepID=A0ABM1RXG7_LIMPO|nr:ADP-ribosylation factor-binding protein GGA1-like [Limulus polyphemus]
MERTARRITELEMGQNNAKVLSDMLFNYKSKETSPGERELMKDLFDCCERLRPKLFRLAGEMDEKDEGLGDILKASDNLTTVINTYKKLILGQDVGPVEFLADRNHKSLKEPPCWLNGETSLLDLASPTEKCGSQRVDSSLLDDQLLALGLSDSKQSTSPRRSPSSAMNGVKTSSDLDDLDQIFSVGNSKTEISNSGFGILISQVNGAGVGSSGSIPVSSTVGVSYSAPVSATPPFHVDENVPKLLQPINTTKSPVPTCATENTDKNSVRTAAVKGLEELDVLSQSLLKKSLPANAPTKSEFPSAPHKIPMNLLPKQPQVQTPSSPSLLRVHHPQDSSSKLETENRVPSVSPSKVSVQDVLSLADITVPLQSIQPGETPSLTLQEKNGLTVIVHFGKDSPRADVTVMVVSTMSRNSCPVKSFNFQAAVPKTMRIKLQPPSATDLPPYNPILPPAAITQVMLLANPNKVS